MSTRRLWAEQGDVYEELLAHITLVRAWKASRRLQSSMASAPPHLCMTERQQSASTPLPAVAIGYPAGVSEVADRRHHASGFKGGEPKGTSCMWYDWIRMRGKQSRWSAALVALAALVGRPAFAQLADSPINTQTPLLDQLIAPSSAGSGTAVEPDVTVATRRRPEYDSPGVRVGNLTIRPQLTESTGYDSNVLGTGAPHGSALVETNALISAVEEFSHNTSLNASVSVDDNRYLNQPTQNFTSWSASLGIVHDFGLDTGSVQYTHQQSALTSLALNVPVLDKPIPTSTDLAQLRYRISLARWFLIPELDVAKYAFENGTVSGMPYLQEYRDRVIASPSLLLGYELAPQRSLITVFRDSRATYSNQSLAPPARNYNDAALLGGFDYAVNGAVRLRALAGYEIREFQSVQYKTIAAPVAEATAIWMPRGKTTITGTIARRIQDSADETTAAFTETYAQLRIDEEYLSNVVLRTTAGIYYTDYLGNGSQTLYSAGLGLTYLLNRNTQLTTTYDFAARQSNAGSITQGNTNVAFGPGYTDHRIILQLRLRL